MSIITVDYINLLQFLIVVRSCKDVYDGGIRKNGIYTLRNQVTELFRVFCDFESEADSVWTLVTSFALNNVTDFRISYIKSNPISEDTPNWIYYRYVLIFQVSLCYSDQHIRYLKPISLQSKYPIIICARSGQHNLQP